MSVKKLSVAIEEGVAAAAAASAEAAGLSLSAWLNQAAADALAVEAGLAAVRGWEAENGAFTAAELNDADRILDTVLGNARRTRRAS